MIYLWLLIGLPLPALCGWLLLKLVEGNRPVLFSFERIVAGFVVGSILVPFAFFLMELSGIGTFTLPWLLGAQLLLVALLGGLSRKHLSVSLHPDHSLLQEIATWKLWQKLVAAALSIWFAIKMIALWILLIGPAYFDDTVKNWNLRGKMFYEQGHLVLESVPGKGIGIGSYPPTVPLMKTWLASLGGWHEGLINSLHIFWLLAALVLLFYVLRRLVSDTWALIGAYLLSSTPLYALHGGIAYADQFLSVVIFMAVAWLLLGLKQHNDIFLRLGAIATGLLVFTKNEALLLHLPPILLIVVVALLFTKRSVQEKKTLILWYIGSVAVVLVPWLLFKWSHSLDFGNAKPLSGMNLQWHEQVLETIMRNTLLMGHWSLLPVLCVGAVAAAWKQAFKTSLIVATAFFLMVWAAQLPIFVLTDLYAEALNQTGYARGIIHLVPIIVLVTTVCLHSLSHKED